MKDKKAKSDQGLCLIFMPSPYFWTAPCRYFLHQIIKKKLNIAIPGKKWIDFTICRTAI